MGEYDSICCFRNRHQNGYRILLEITDKCNANCVFCHWRDKSSLSLEQIKTIINNLKEITIHDIIITGGEPLLHNEIFEILEWLKTSGIECDLCTNGIMINEEIAEKLSKYLSEISISLDTSKPEVYDMLRGTKNGFDRVINGIKCLNQWGIDVHLTCVVNKENQSEVENIVKLSRSLQIHSISFLGLITEVAKRREETENIALTEDEKCSFMNKIKELRKKYFDILINTKRMDQCEKEICRAGKNILGITSEGKIMGCIMRREKQFDILNEVLDETMLNELQKNQSRC